MNQEYFYVLGGGMNVRNRYGAIMRLGHNLVIGQFYLDGGGGSSFLEVVNGSGHRTCVGRASTIYGRVMMFRVGWGRNKTTRMTNIHSISKKLRIIKIN